MTRIVVSRSAHMTCEHVNTRTDSLLLAGGFLASLGWPPPCFRILTTATFTEEAIA